jgi:signal transduction histidine kinase/CheY-like chemotaxis protein
MPAPLPSADPLIDEAWAQHHRNPAQLVALGTALVTQSLPDSARAGQGWLQVAWGMRFRGDAEGASQALARAKALAERSGDAALAANVRDLQAMDLVLARRWDDAQAMLDSAAPSAARPRSPWERCSHHHRRAWLLDCMGRRDDGLRERHAMLAAARETGDDAPVATALGQLCGLHTDLFNLDEADRLGAQAVALAERCGAFNAWVVAALNHLNAQVALRRGAAALPLALRLQAQEVRMSARAAEQRCIVYADVHAQAGELDRAQAWLDDSVRRRHAGSASLLSWTTVQVETLLARGDAAQARRMAEAWLRAPDHGTDPASLPSELLRLLHAASRACELEGDAAAALAHARQAFGVHETLVGRSARARRLSLEIEHELDRARWEREQASQRQRNAELEGRRLDALNRELAAANAAKTRFLAAASHDLRQPVQALAMFLSALQREALPASAAQLVDRMGRSLDGLTDLFDALIDVSRLDAGVVPVRPLPLALAPLLRRLVDELDPQAQARGLQLRLYLGPGAEQAATLTDAALLERCLRNLLDNALKYTDKAGVVLSLRPRPGQPAGWRLQVLDRGQGMTREVQARAFDEFFQADNPGRDRRQGLGLGLAIVRRLVQLLGLPLGLSSTPGRGSRFWLDLPHQDEVADHPPALPVADLQPSLRVAVLDDDADVRDALAALLGHWGHAVVAGADLEGLLAAWQAGDGRVPQALLVDLRLADGLQGLDAARALLGQWGTALPTLVITGDVSPEPLRLIEASGLPWLPKPVMPMRLRAWLNACSLRDGVRDDGLPGAPGPALAEPGASAQR